MISFRYHVVSIAATLLALAAGVALGAGPLSDSANIVGGGDDTTKTAADASGLAQFESAYAKRTGGALVSGKLEGTSVVFFELPGARSDQIKGLESAFTNAGATVLAHVALQDKLIDSSGRQFAEGVAQQSTKGVDGITTGGDSFAMIGSALGRAFLAKKTTKVDTSASTISSAFVEGGLIDVEKTPKKRAELAVLIAGSDQPKSDLGQADIAVALAKAFDGAAKGTLFAGPTTASLEDGYVAELRSSDTAADVSSVDVINSTAGQLIATLVAAAELKGKSGAYGTSRSADGAIPR